MPRPTAVVCVQTYEREEIQNNLSVLGTLTFLSVQVKKEGSYLHFGNKLRSIEYL